MKLLQENPRRDAVFLPVLRYIEAVAREGSIRKAASKVHLTASAVDRQILELEAKVGFPIFERLPRGMRLTSSGKLLLDAYKKARSDLEQSLLALAAVREAEREHVSIGALQFLSERAIPAVLHDVSTRYPKSTFSVLAANSDAIVERVAGGQLDMGVCWDTPASVGLHRICTFKVRLGAVTRRDHPLAKRAEVPLRDCLAYRVIFPKREMELRAKLDQLLLLKGISVRPCLETNSAALMRELLLKGGWVLLGAAIVAGREITSGHLVFRSFLERRRHVATLSILIRDKYRLSSVARVVASELTRALSEELT